MPAEDAPHDDFGPLPPADAPDLSPSDRWRLHHQAEHQAGTWLPDPGPRLADGCPEAWPRDHEGPLPLASAPLSPSERWRISEWMADKKRRVQAAAAAPAPSAPPSLDVHVRALAANDRRAASPRFCSRCGAARAHDAARFCIACGERLEAVAAAPRRPLGDDPGMRMLLPVGRSPLAIVAGYLGLLSLALVPAPIALIVGILAIRDLRRHPEKRGMGRAVFAVVMGGLFTILFALLIIMSA